MIYLQYKDGAFSQHFDPYYLCWDGSKLTSKSKSGEEYTLSFGRREVDNYLMTGDWVVIPDIIAFRNKYGFDKMKPKVKSKITVYEFGIDELIDNFAAQFNVSRDKVHVEFKQKDISDDRFESTSHYVPYAIEVTINESI